MSYSLSEIKIAAYNWTELPDMTQRQRALWMGLGYCYDCFRTGEPKEVCEELMKKYIKLFWDKEDYDAL